MPRRARQSPALPNIDLLPDSASLRLSQIIALTGIGRSTFLWWVQTGRFPRPTKIGPRISVWKVGDVRRLLAAPTVTPATIDPNVAAAVAKRKANRITEAEHQARKAALLGEV